MVHARHASNTTLADFSLPTVDPELSPNRLQEHGALDQLRTPSSRAATFLEGELAPRIDNPKHIWRGERLPHVATADKTYWAVPERSNNEIGILGMSGFGAFAMKVMTKARPIAIDNNVPVGVRALPGHNGSISELSTLTATRAIDSVIKWAERETEKYGFEHLIGLGHSTAGLLMICAETRFQASHPGQKLFSRLVLTAPPFEYYDKATEAKIRKYYNVYTTLSKFPYHSLEAAQYVLDNYWGKSPFPRPLPEMMNFIRNFEVPYSMPTANSAKLDKNAPAMCILPLNLFFVLDQLRVEALTSLPKLKIPILYIHGDSDTVAEPKGSVQAFQSRTEHNKKNCTVKIYENCGHSSIYEEPRRADGSGNGSRFLRNLRTFITQTRIDYSKSNW